MWFIIIEFGRENVVRVCVRVMGWTMVEWLDLHRVQPVCKRTFVSIRHDFFLKVFL